VKESAKKVFDPRNNLKNASTKKLSVIDVIGGFSRPFPVCDGICGSGRLIAYKGEVQMRPNPVSVEPVEPFVPSVETTKTPSSSGSLPRNGVDTLDVNAAEQWLNNLFAEPRIARPITNPIAERNQASAEIQTRFQQQFSAVAGDKQRFDVLMRQTYGAGYDATAAESFRQKALGGDYSWLPSIEFRNDSTLRGGNGAFDASRNIVLLNERFLGDPDRAAAIYSEEVGHFLDTQINKQDTVGDEGEMFRRLMSGENLTAAQRTAIQSDNDHGVITVDGKLTEVEFSIFDDIWDGVKKVGGAIVDGVQWVGDRVVDGVEWIAPRVADAVHSLGTGVINTVRGIGMNVWEGITTFGSGFGKLFQGDFGGAFEAWGSGLVKVALQTPADAFLMTAGRSISAIQTLVGLEPPGRDLTAAEITALRQVYGDSIDYSKVRIKEGSSGLFSLTGRAFTHGDTIYVPNDNLPLTNDLLVHEMGHVWQHQNGGTDYMSEALWAQNFGDGYDFEKGINEGKPWSELNPEQQSELLQTAYRSGFFNTPGARFVYNGTDYTDYLNNALTQVRNGQGAP
jgi:hypothetical protein